MSVPSSSERERPSRTLQLSYLAMMHSQLDSDPCTAMQVAMKCVFAGGGKSYFPPFGGAFGSGGSSCSGGGCSGAVVVFGLGASALLCEPVAWPAGLAGTGFFAFALPAFGACFELVVLGAAVCVPWLAGAVVAAFVLVVLLVLAVFVEPQPLATTASATTADASSRHVLRRCDLDIVHGY
jgi:hypothetical protein